MAIKSKKKGLMTRSLLIVCGIVAVIALLYYSGAGHYMTLENMHKQSEHIQVMLQESYMKAVMYYMLLFTLCIALTLPFVGPFAILGGYLFGLFPGFLYALVAACVGSTCSFLIIRYLLSSLIRNRYKTKLERFNEKIKVYGFSYLLTLQLLSVIPYVVINTLAALADVPLSAFLWTTIVGSVPLIFIYTLAGRKLGTLQSMSDILSADMLLLLILLACLALVPMILKKFKNYEV